MKKQEYPLLTNSKKLFKEIKRLEFDYSFVRVDLPKKIEDLIKLFTDNVFIFIVIDLSLSINVELLNRLIDLLNEHYFPALFVVNNETIIKLNKLDPVNIDYLVKPFSDIDIRIRVKKLFKVFKIMKKLLVLRDLESEIHIRENIMELSRQELLNNSEVIRALDKAMELSRQEQLFQKEEIAAREKVMELADENTKNLLGQIQALQETLRLADLEKENYDKEIKALENVLEYMKENRKEYSKVQQAQEATLEYASNEIKILNEEISALQKILEFSRQRKIEKEKEIEAMHKTLDLASEERKITIEEAKALEKTLELSNLEKLAVVHNSSLKKLIENLSFNELSAVQHMINDLLNEKNKSK